MEWLQSADVLVTEVTTVPIDVGYEIGRAVESGKKVQDLEDAKSAIKRFLKD